MFNNSLQNLFHTHLYTKRRCDVVVYQNRPYQDFVLRLPRRSAPRNDKPSKFHTYVYIGTKKQSETAVASDCFEYRTSN